MENKDEGSANHKPARSLNVVQILIVGLSVSLIVVYSILVFYLVIFVHEKSDKLLPMQNAIMTTSASSLGLPAAALAAFFLVWAFPYVSNDKITEIKAMGIEFKGVASQVVLWVFVYLSIVASIVITCKLYIVPPAVQSTGTVTSLVEPPAKIAPQALVR